MSDLSKKLKTAGAIAAISGGVLFAGSQVNKPECAYVLMDNQKEICLTTEQAQVIFDKVKGNNTGFGKSQFEGLNLIKK